MNFNNDSTLKLAPFLISFNIPSSQNLNENISLI